MKHACLVLVLSVAFAAALASRPAPAAAWFQVCNHSDEKVTLAVASEDFFSATVDGWWNLEVGACATPIGDDIDTEDVYIYAYSTNHTWDGSSSFCIDPNYRFHYDDDQADSKCPTGVEKDFERIDTGTYKNYTDNLTLY